MELVEIIFDILILSTLMLAVVVLFSYLRSKRKVESLMPVRSTDGRINDPVNRLSFNQESEQKYLRENVEQVYPQIFQLDNKRPREIKVIRRPSTFTNNGEGIYRSEPDPQSKIPGSGSRYIIINDETKKTPEKAANFFS